MSKAFGQQTPTQGEDAVSWQTFSDGAGGIPNTTVDIDWGKLSLQTAGAEGRSAVYDLGASRTRKFKLTENRYGNGSGSAVLQIRGSTTIFTQDDTVVDWETYTAPVEHDWQWVQVRETTYVYYYVDATLGDDGNPGTRALPWQTITKVNAAALNPGDHVLFKRGETFAGRLYPLTSGSASQFIVYGAYGSGNRPIIDGSGNSALVVESPVHYLRYEHIDFNGTSVAGSHTVRYYSDNGYFYDCIFQGALGDPWGCGFTAHTDTGVELYNITIDTCQAYSNYSSGISIGSDTGAGGPHDCLVTNCIAHDNGHSTSADHGIYVRHGVVIDKCTSYTNTSGGFKVNCEGVQDSPYKPIIKNCTSYDNRYGIIANNIDAIIYNNLVYGCSYTAIQIGADSDNNLIYFNTFSNCTAGNALVEVNGNPASAIIKNNIFVQDHEIYDKGWLATVGALTLEEVIAANTFDYNIYFHNALGDGHGFLDSTNHTFAVWQGLGADTNSTLLVVDPEFVARYTDYHPADAGNLKALGLAISGYGFDQDGNNRADPPTPGCYEESAP